MYAEGVSWILDDLVLIWNQSKNRVARNSQKSPFLTGNKLKFSDKIRKIILSKLIILHLYVNAETKKNKAELPDFCI